jgi:hypothetical protein
MKMKNTLDNSKYHFFFIFVLSLNYFFPLIVFQEITLFYHDVLDAGVVYFHVLGKYLNGDKSSLDAFLNGVIKVEYLRHWLKPYTLIYVVFSTPFAYWFTEILVKITAYFSFFILAKKISKNFFISSLCGALYACLNIGSIEGFGTAIFPYLLYLSVFKNNLKLKNYLIIIFFGLNSDLVRDMFLLPILLGSIWIINHQLLIERKKKIIQILILFFLGMLASSSNLIYSQLFEGPFHREEFFRTSITYKESIIGFLKNLVNLNISKTWVFFFSLPKTIFLAPLLIISFLKKDNFVKRILLFYIIINLFIFLLNVPLVNEFKNNLSGFFRSFNFHWIRVYLPFLAVFLLLYNLKKNHYSNRILIVFSFISLIIFQVNSTMVPLIKKSINKNDFRNYYTFNGYYLYEDYKKIKDLVGDKRVISLGLDPMVAVMNDIKTIDGYHTLYPLDYKHKFRNIIEKQLDESKKYRDYYDNWGSRVYAFVENPNDIKIDFMAAKKLGADFVISKYKINNDNLSLKCVDCSKHFLLYKIN